jgi:hypothetical protein
MISNLCDRSLIVDSGGARCEDSRLPFNQLFDIMWTMLKRYSILQLEAVLGEAYDRSIDLSASTTKHVFTRRRAGPKKAVLRGVIFGPILDAT